MKRASLSDPIDHLAVENEARRLRAEAIATHMGALRRWVVAPFHRRSVI